MNSVSREMLCPPDIFHLEIVLHFEKGFKNHGIEGFYRKACYITQNDINGNTVLPPVLMLNQSFFSSGVT
jgi:hypothetical protein